jgi:hypothetical protein
MSTYGDRNLYLKLVGTIIFFLLSLGFLIAEPFTGTYLPLVFTGSLFFLVCVLSLKRAYELDRSIAKDKHGRRIKRNV